MESRLQVWDATVRVLHWTLAGAVAMGWLTTLGWASSWHEAWGYAAVAVVVARAIWGFTGSPHARFAGFVRSRAQVLEYAHQVRKGTEPRFIGHNPLGGWMVVALLASVAAAGFTGWLFTTDMFWGYGWLSTLHEALAWLVLVLVVLHLCGVVFTSIRHRENLVRAMITGRKSAP